MTILLFSTGWERRRVEVLLTFATDSFPQDASIIDLWTKERDEITLMTDAGSTRLADISAVWFRTELIGRNLPSAMDATAREVCAESARIIVESTIAAREVFQLDPYWNLRRANNKPRQLALARHLQLETPRTLVTNDADAVREFARTCGGRIVTKMPLPFANLGTEDEPSVMYTSQVSALDLDMLDGLNLCPMIFQEQVAKAKELRVTIVGHRVFAAAVDSQIAKACETDWRADQEQLLEKWTEHELPDPIRARLLALFDELGLNFGGADLILTPDGRYVFLEVNPTGSFRFQEELLGFPISEAIADLLLDPETRRLQAG